MTAPSPAQAETTRNPRAAWRGYAFRIAIACILAAVILRPGEDRVSEAIARISTLGPMTYGIGFGCVALAFYVYAFIRQRRHPEDRFRNGSLLFRAAIATAGSVVYLGIWATSSGARSDLPFLVAAAIYAGVALAARSALIGVFALAASGGWVGAPSGFAPEWGSIPTATGFALFGVCVWLLRLRGKTR